MMPTFRCLNCKAESEAARLEVAACPACDLDAAKNPRDAETFVKVEVMHFDPPTRVPGRGKNHAACNPLWKVGTGGRRFTGEPAVVTCPACIASQAFIDANGEANGVLAMPVVPRTPKEG